ncbi:hypothetical protein NDU88_004700 [Pleurodeles waltl]|uniref:Uncharacterized protein n=1 Tax=Pleurodeles waltl TaxID=8319 RepID=A0AAV7TT67_PLEWA|nr:hypothetical protein NDU88_004700 [Pleurodeles waltl]
MRRSRGVQRRQREILAVTSSSQRLELLQHQPRIARNQREHKATVALECLDLCISKIAKKRKCFSET